VTQRSEGGVKEWWWHAGRGGTAQKRGRRGPRNGGTGRDAYLWGRGWRQWGRQARVVDGGAPGRGGLAGYWWGRGLPGKGGTGQDLGRLGLGVQESVEVRVGGNEGGCGGWEA
jgi:hypothetical protein